MAELMDLPNVSKVLEANLRKVGIDTPEQLHKVGCKEAFLRIRAIDPGACLHMLYGLQGACDGVRDTLLSEDTRRDLRTFFAGLQ